MENIVIKYRRPKTAMNAVIHDIQYYLLAH